MASPRRYATNGEIADDIHTKILAQLRSLGIQIPDGTGGKMSSDEVDGILQRVAAIGWVASAFGLDQANKNPPTHGRGEGTTSPSVNRPLTDDEFAELEELFADTFPT